LIFTKLVFCACYDVKADKEHLMLQNKNIVLGVTGGIAAYKACDLVSRLKKLGANVNVVMTRAATEFVTPLTFQTLSQNPVAVEMFQQPGSWEIEHIALAKKADLLVVAPATADMIGKIAGGIADDLLSTTIMATGAPVLLAPAMNTHMYQNPIVQENISRLKSFNYRLIAPETGRLACGDVGEGKMASPETLLAAIVKLLIRQPDLAGKRILITAGPTREAIDPVRFISNHSSGKMGYALARAAAERDAVVTLISGPVGLPRPNNVDLLIPVESAAEMYRQVMAHYQDQDIVIMAAAVADYRPKAVSPEKIKKTNNGLTLELEKNTDILLELGQNKGNHILVGFAAETQNLLEYSREKLVHKNLDLIVANDLTEEGAGFGGDTNIIRIIHRSGQVDSLPKLTKTELGHIILDKVRSLLEPAAAL
jgi:phosphopantothenoylcysteine decarboxylase / phosphopantothenate---cysteine ligase